MAVLAFSVGGLHLQIQCVTLHHKIEMSLFSKKISSVVNFCHLFFSYSRGTGDGGGLECSLFVEKCQEGFEYGR